MGGLQTWAGYKKEQTCVVYKRKQRCVGYKKGFVHVPKRGCFPQSETTMHHTLAKQAQRTIITIIQTFPDE